jgi:hypothetical protein
LPLIVLFACVLAPQVEASECTIGVFYYPWYKNDFHGRHYLREHLVPRQWPVLGEYDDRVPEVIKQHGDWSRYAGIRIWAASWWGPGSREDTTLLNHILPDPGLGDIKVAILYETTGRTSNFTDYARIAGDFDYLARHYFHHENYLKIDGRPVVVVYLTRVLSSLGSLAESVGHMRSGASSQGFDAFIIGDHVFGSPPENVGDMGLLDAITEYDVYGSIGASGYAGEAGVSAYAARQNSWKALATGAGVGYVPSITPGFNDKGVREGHAPVSRRLSPDMAPGSLFRTLLESALGRTDPSLGHLLFVTSWNEWHEDTQIEPVQSAPATSLDDSPSGQDYTTGLDYEGYDTLYLDILRDEVPNSGVDSWDLHR